jgi:hypothetical protein
MDVCVSIKVHVILGVVYRKEYVSHVTKITRPHSFNTNLSYNLCKIYLTRCYTLNTQTLVVEYQHVKEGNEAVKTFMGGKGYTV